MLIWFIYGALHCFFHAVECMAVLRQTCSGHLNSRQARRKKDSNYQALLGLIRPPWLDALARGGRRGWQGRRAGSQLLDTAPRTGATGVGFFPRKPDKQSFFSPRLIRCQTVNTNNQLRAGGREAVAAG